MKTNITKSTMNVDKLTNELERFCVTHEYNPYIIMSQETADAIGCQICSDYYFDYAKFAYVSYFRGYKILIDNELKFGEVDIR